MDDNFKILYKNYLRIKRLGWVKSLRSGHSGVGYTFETLLGKEEDCFRYPDYYGIEIKTMKYFSKHTIHLFSAVPDGDTLFPIPRILSSLGFPDKKCPEFKVFMATINAKDYSAVGYKRIKIKLNWEKEKVDLIAYSTYGKIYNLETSWSFKMLKDAFYLKFNQLAVIKACSKTIHGVDYFWYSDIDFYKRKSFDTFLKLLEDGTIEVNFQIGVWREGKKKGMIHDRGTNFSIKEEDLTKLFDKI